MMKGMGGREEKLGKGKIEVLRLYIVKRNKL